MNVNSLIRMVTRRIVGRGINAGVDHMARGGKTMQELTPDERTKVRNTRKTAGRVRQALNMLRRIGRF